MVATPRTSIPSHRRERWACDGPEALEATELGRAGPDQREDRPLLTDVLDLDLAADAVGTQVGEDGGGRVGLEVEPDVTVREPEDAQVGLHVPLAVEERRVAALAGLERLDVVGELPLQVLGRVGAADEDLAAPGAIEQPAFLAQLPVLGVELDCRRVGHLLRFYERPATGLFRLIKICFR